MQDAGAAVGALEPPVGDGAVGGLREVDTDPLKCLRWTCARCYIRQAAECAGVEVVWRASCSTAGEEGRAAVESCHNT